MQNSVLTAAQVFGLFAVTATATGSLYFLDSNKVASNGGLNAAGVLLLILNLAYLLAAGVAIASAGSQTVRIFIRKQYSKLILGAQTALGVRSWQQKALGVRLSSGRTRSDASDLLGVRYTTTQ